ncbi:MAG: hypothetical protein WAN96_07630, partial [Paludibacteraceae bacterium]
NIPDTLYMCAVCPEALPGISIEITPFSPQTLIPSAARVERPVIGEIFTSVLTTEPLNITAYPLVPLAATAAPSG